MQLGFESTGRLTPTWRTDAACRFMAPEMFFPGDTTTVAAEQIETAKATCHSCPVQGDCLRFALETKQEDGIWGGTTEDERRRLRRAWIAERRQRTKVTP